jgi:amidohydrolase
VFPVTSDARPRPAKQKAAAAAAVARIEDRLTSLSKRLHAHPETAWEEHRAASWVGQALVDLGFAVEGGFLGLETALHATYGDGSTRIGLCAEYDALPGLGHACGHNLIAAASLGAAAGLAQVADDLGLTVEVYGTPAEEGGGGKIEMLERGAFTGLDLAMMAHPAPVDIAEARPFAVSHSHVTFRGKAAHAAAYPEQGINAADAITLAQVAVGLLRQQLPAGVRVHGVVTHGGDAPNAIPERTEGRWYVRAGSIEELDGVASRVWRCFQGAALATGCELQIEPESKPYAEFRADDTALASYRRNALRLGRRFDAGIASRMNRASTDMGNVSQKVPAIHPYFGIGSWPALNHQKEFAAHCAGPDAHRAMLDAATGLAWTGIDVASARCLRCGNRSPPAHQTASAACSPNSASRLARTWRTAS